MKILNALLFLKLNCKVFINVQNLRYKNTLLLIFKEDILKKITHLNLCTYTQVNSFDHLYTNTGGYPAPFGYLQMCTYTPVNGFDYLYTNADGCLVPFGCLQMCTDTPVNGFNHLYTNIFRYIFTKTPINIRLSSLFHLNN